MTFEQFFAGALDAALAGGGLFCILDPADEFIAAKRSNALPPLEQCGVCEQRVTQVRWNLMDGAVEQIRLYHYFAFRFQKR